MKRNYLIPVAMKMWSLRYLFSLCATLLLCTEFGTITIKLNDSFYDDFLNHAAGAPHLRLLRMY